MRKNLQILSARGDRLWRAVRDLQTELDDLEAEQGATRYRMDQILQRLRSMAEPSLTGQTHAVSTMKVSKSQLKFGNMDFFLKHQYKITLDFTQTRNTAEVHMHVHILLSILLDFIS